MKKTLKYIGLGLLFSACSTMKPAHKRIATTLGSAVACGAIVGQLAKDRDGTETEGSVYKSASLCGAVGLAAGEYYFTDNERLKKLESELAVYRNFENNQLATQKTLPAHIIEGMEIKSFGGKLEGKSPFCQKRTLLLCPKDNNPSLFDNCQEPSLLYLSPNWAIEYRAWYSDSACWADRKMAEVPGLTEYLNKTFIQTYMDLERRSK